MLAVPSDPGEVGWWMSSPGELVLDGHVDMEGVGPGALFELRTLRPGAAITVADRRRNGTLDGGRRTDLLEGPLAGRAVHWPGPRLVLITCGGPFDWATHHYYDNVLVYASPAR